MRRKFPNQLKVSLNCISSPVSIPESIILSIVIPMITTMRRKQIDTPFSQALAERVAVVRLVTDHSLGAGPWPPWPLFLQGRSSHR